ncbi:hypothetical protein [Subtercola vilae]|uniref:hypothetical protein n=1 Tax=Subtercola vilae TaxID=2056433 RepID=UPI0010AA36C6|nr:hypothetical protein [Subtercola vilae]
MTEESVSARWIGSRSLGDLSDVQARTMASMARSHARQCAAAGQVLIIAATVVLGSYLPAWVASVASFDGSNEASGSFIGPILAVGGLALAVVLGLRLGDSAERSRRDAAVFVRVHVRGGPVSGETELRRTDPSAAAG